MASASETKGQEERDFLSHLPQVKWMSILPIYQWKGYWLDKDLVKCTMAIESQFKPLPSDVMIASFPKTGTTWLKALTASILHRQNDPLLTHNPHELVPFLEREMFGDSACKDVNKMDSPRLYNTHLPLSLLPDSILSSGCRVIYIARNPMDTLVSYWHFFKKMLPSDTPLEVAYEEFCKGTVLGGPFLDHVLEYWSQREKENVLFLTYEDLKEDIIGQVERIAKFLGQSLDVTEVEEIASRSSHKRLIHLDVNKSKDKVHFSGVDYGSFFRRGVVGDHINHLTPSMVDQLKQITFEKLQGSGLQFKL